MPSSETLNAAPEKSPLFSQPTGYLLGKLGAIMLFIILFLSARHGQVLLVLLSSLTLSAIGFARLWSHLSLKALSCQLLLGEHRVFPGERIELKLRLVNRKPLPLPWIQVDTPVPNGLSLDDCFSPLAKNTFQHNYMSHTTPLSWYSSINWRHQLRCDRRGYYPLKPPVVTSGDIFGLYPRSTSQFVTENIIVYPRIFTLAQLGIPLLSPLGETRAERRIFEDPHQTIGVRDYTSQDSFRQIHWKASARRQNLAIKVFEPTTSLKIALFLAIDSFQDGELCNEEDLELGISVAASLANHVVQQHCPIGLFTNTCLADTGKPIKIPPGSSRGQLVRILEALAKTTSLVSSPFEDFLQDERPALPWGTTIIFIISRPPEFLQELIATLKRAGYKTIVLQIGSSQNEDSNRSVAWYNIKHAADRAEVIA